MLFDIFFGEIYGRLLARAAQCGPDILELGCGEGRLAIELASRGLKVTGIDLSGERIKRAIALANASRSPLHPPVFQVGDLNTIRLDAGRFDCVVAHDALHHILHLSRLCDEVKKALKPGGLFLIMDYIGMGRIRKILAGALYGLLPTYQTYGAKWKLRKRLRAFLATERQKREALERSPSGALHHDSPFEEISQGSIVTEVENRFVILEQETICPFWFYLAPKVRVPARWKEPIARSFRTMDDLIMKTRLTQGAYVWIAAQKPDP